MKRKILFSVLLLFLFFGYSNAETVFVRINVIENAPALKARVKGFYEITNPKNGSVLFRGKNLVSDVTTYTGGIMLKGIKFKGSRITLKAADTDSININNLKVRGFIEIIKDDKDKFMVVNYIEMEDYIKGILYHEVSHYWPFGVLKAQAIVSRTYAAYQLRENKAKDFDMRSDIYSQVYGGRASERYRTNKAVDETKGMIICYKGRVIPAYFHAACAGHTEDASLLWKTNLKPLKGVECNFCKDSPHFHWTYSIDKGTLIKKLSDAGHKTVSIDTIGIDGRDKSQRITDLIITSGKKTVRIPAKDFRLILGPNLIRSTNFDVKAQGDNFVFEGKGWGHGVGMCQWGAYFMAKNGAVYSDIISYYYPGTEIGYCEDMDF